MDRRRFLAAVGASLAVGCFAKASKELPIEGSLPSLGNATAWLNSQPLVPTALHGKVVLVNFCTYTCINWLRSLPWVRAWAAKYKSQGLAVIGVHSPEFSIERSVDNVRRVSANLGIDYPIAIDNDYAIWRAFKNEYWPALYFIDAKGRIRHHQFGEGSYDKSELVIQQLLREAGANGVDERPVTVEARGLEAAADWSSLQSPENYLGADRTENFVSSRRQRQYVSPARLKADQWTLAGNWKIGNEAIVSNAAHGRIAYRFHARDLHLVMAPSIAGRSVPFRVLVDGQPPRHSHGLDSDENGFGTLAEPRLYQLIRQPKPVIDRQFEIEFLDRGAEAFAFTFG